MTIKFEIDLQKNKDNVFRQLICSGEWTWTSKTVGSTASYIYNGYFNRISEIRPASDFLVASYNFDNNPIDSTPNGNILTNVGNVTYSTSDFVRGSAAALFNGSNYFQISNDGRFSPDNLTVAVWIKPKTVTSIYQTIASCRATATLRGWMLYISPDSTGSNLEIWSSSDGVNYTGQTSVYPNLGRLNRWVHVAFTLNKSTSALIVYIDGVVATTTTLGYTNNTVTNLRIGAGSNEGTATLYLANGTLIDDLHIFNKVSTASEITHMYSSTLFTTTLATNTDTSLVASFNFDSNMNDSATNYTNNLQNYNSVTYSTSEYIRGSACASFNGTNCFFITNNDFRFTPPALTIAVWVKPSLTGTAVYQSIATCREAPYPYTNLRGWTIYINPSNKLEVTTGGNTSPWSGVESSAAVPTFVDGVWTHLAITLSRTTNSLSVYTNGVFRETTTRSYASTTSTTTPMRIGAGGDTAAYEFLLKNGTLIDDFRFYNRILTPTEISNIYSGTMTTHNTMTLNDIGICGFTSTSPGPIEHVTMNLAVDALPSFS